MRRNTPCISRRAVHYCAPLHLIGLRRSLRLERPRFRRDAADRRAAIEIPPGRRARRRALPGATTCVACQSGRDSKIMLVGINRRGSKDSQLR